MLKGYYRGFLPGRCGYIYFSCQQNYEPASQLFVGSLNTPFNTTKTVKVSIGSPLQ